MNRGNRGRGRGRGRPSGFSSRTPFIRPATDAASCSASALNQRGHSASVSMNTVPALMTMVQEARSTERHHEDWFSLKLRDLPINFIKAAEPLSTTDEGKEQEEVTMPPSELSGPEQRLHAYANKDMSSRQSLVDHGDQKNQKSCNSAESTPDSLSACSREGRAIYGPARNDVPGDSKSRNSSTQNLTAPKVNGDGEDGGGDSPSSRKSVKLAQQFEASLTLGTAYPDVSAAEGPSTPPENKSSGSSEDEVIFKGRNNPNQGYHRTIGEWLRRSMLSGSMTSNPFTAEELDTASQGVNLRSHLPQLENSMAPEHSSNENDLPSANLSGSPPETKISDNDDTAKNDKSATRDKLLDTQSDSNKDESDYDGDDADSIDPDWFQSANTFDVTDYSRPSLRPRKGDRPFLMDETLDPEVEAQLREVYSRSLLTRKQKRKDREQTKKQKKEERRLKRAGVDILDLRPLYERGMHLNELREEFISFMESDANSLFLPPMDKYTRKKVHSFAHTLGMTSTSRGSGLFRYTTLTKTARTGKFNDQNFASAARMIRRTWLQNPAYRGPELPPSSIDPEWEAKWYGPSTRRLRDGDVVGEGAAEIAEGNRGRAMLEKMGWSDGMGLGATENKGRLKPVEQIVKRSRTGLG